MSLSKLLGRALMVTGFLVSVNAVAAPVEIVMWDNEDPEPAKSIDAWIKIFQTSNPDIKVTRITYQTEDLRQKFITTATAGKAADLVWGPNDMAGPLVTANLLQPAFETFAKAADFFPAALEAVKLDGKLWGVPTSYGNHLLLMYNKDLVKNPPKTTDELIKVAKQLTKADKKEYGLVMNNNEPFWFAPIMGAFGAWPLEVDAKGKAKVTLNNEANKKALTFLKSLKSEHKIIPSECDYDCARGLFSEKKAAMIINGDWFVDEARKALGDKLGLAPLPVVSPAGKPMTPMVSGRFMFVNRKTTKQDAVKKFVAFMTSKPIQIELANKLGRIPALKAAQSDAAVAGNATIKALMDAAVNGRAMPPQVEMRAAWDGMRPVQQKVMAEKITPDAAVVEMQKLADERLKGLNE